MKLESKTRFGISRSALLRCQITTMLTLFNWKCEVASFAWDDLFLILLIHSSWLVLALMKVESRKMSVKPRKWCAHDPPQLLLIFQNCKKKKRHSWRSWGAWNTFHVRMGRKTKNLADGSTRQCLGQL